MWTRFCVTPFIQGGGPELVHCRPPLISFSFLFSLLNGLLLVRTPPQSVRALADGHSESLQPEAVLGSEAEAATAGLW